MSFRLMGDISGETTAIEIQGLYSAEMESFLLIFTHPRGGGLGKISLQEMSFSSAEIYKH
jgi:hypothetical protein